MPRYRRQTPEGSLQHVISRFVNGEHRFAAEGARAEYLRRAAGALSAADWRALAFGLMSSHVHWAMRAGRRPSAAIIKPLHAGFATSRNVKERRLGPVFADRHRTLTFEADTAAALIAYIHNNPVRAGVVDDPADSDWTSHRAYLGLVPRPPWLDVPRGLAMCGFSDTPSGRLAFHEMVVARSSERRRVDLSGGDMAVRRKAVRAAVHVPVEIATPRVTLVGGELHLELPELEPPGHYDPYPAWLGTPAAVLAMIARVTNTELSALQSRTRARRVAHARRLALLTWTLELRRPASELARVLGLSSSSAAELISTASASARATAIELGRILRGEWEPEPE